MAQGTRRAVRPAADHGGQSDERLGWRPGPLGIAVTDLPPRVAQEIAPLWRLAGRGHRQGRTMHCLHRTVDVMLVLATAWLWLPMLGLCCLLVKVDAPAAPVLFVQQRTGRGGRRFAMYKIRTMVPDAEARLGEVVHLNQRAWPDFKIARDPRVTLIGAFLRRCHLDELPQLLNILRGDMTLVGPRPITLPIEAHEPWQRRRFDVAPGLTGLWQVVQDEVYDFDLRVRLDLLYVQRSCMVLDLAILALTLDRVVRSMRGGKRRERRGHRPH
ncbi:MAG: sugar transferase [Dongiaceae bacterium]